jgi:hypothetical protein
MTTIEGVLPPDHSRNLDRNEWTPQRLDGRQRLDRNQVTRTR